MKELINYKPRHVIVYNDNIKEEIYTIFDKLLISLGKIFTGENFSYDSLLKLNRKIKNIRKYAPDKTIFIDSGGYSVIVGDVPKYTINRLIDIYTYYIEHFYDLFDKVFSLDIPLSIKLDINYYDTIYNYNTISQEKTTKVISKHNKLSDKLYFVWQFKTPKLFDIWKRVYEENKLYKYYKYYAIGGLVGLKNFANIKFSGYIVPLLYSQRLYKQYHNKLPEVQYFHVLGQYAAIDQLTILVIEKYLNKKYNMNYFITYDSAAIHSGFMDIRDKYYITYYDNIYTLENIDKIIDEVELLSNYKSDILDLINDIKKGNRFRNSNIAKYLYAIDIALREKYYYTIADKLVDILLNSKKQKQVEEHIRKALIQLMTKDKYAQNIFTQQFINNAITNLKILFYFDNKYPTVEDKDKMMHKFIELIGLNEFIQ